MANEDTGVQSEDIVKRKAGLPYQIILFFVHTRRYVFSKFKLEHFKSSLSGLTLMEDMRCGGELGRLRNVASFPLNSLKTFGLSLPGLKRIHRRTHYKWQILQP